MLISCITRLTIQLFLRAQSSLLHFGFLGTICSLQTGYGSLATQREWVAAPPGIAVAVS